jgi:phosphoribosylformimino-5-aminoimidazole carboxamide ribotide isomerase
MLKRLQASPFQILPAIDLRGGRVVRLSEGDFGRETVYGDDPAAVARSFAQAGAEWIHVVDLDGARDGERRQTAVVASIVAAAGTSVACEIAGGLRDEAAVTQALDAGASRAVVGTAALRDPALAGQLVKRFGPDRIAVALDVRDGQAVGQGWVPGAAGIPAYDALVELSNRGVRTFVVTAIERDGLLGGPNLELLGSMVELDRGDIIASAGISSIDDIRATRRIGCSGAIVGRALYEGRILLADAVRVAAE